MKKLPIKISSILFFMILLLASCTKYKKMDDNYVLLIKDVGLRKGVFIRRYQLTGEYGRQDRFTAEILKKYIKEILEPNYLFIQHAHDLGMHQEPGTARKIKEYRMNLLADSHPIKFEQLTILKDELRDFYEKKSVRYDIDVIQTNSATSADSLYKLLLEGHEIERPKEMSATTFPQYFQYKNVTYGELLHPEIFAIIQTLNEGDVSRPAYIASIWTIIRLNKKVKNKDLESFDQMENRLLQQSQAVFKYEQQKQLLNELKKKYPASVKTQFYSSMLDAYRLVDQRRVIDKSKIDKDELEATFLKIKDDKIALSDFISSFNQANQFFQIPHLTEKDLSHFVDEYIAHHLLYLDAFEKQVEHDPLIKDKLENKEHRILLNQYLNEEIARKVVITDDDARKYYQQTRGKWEADYEKIASNVKNELKNKRLVDKKNELVNKLQNKYPIRYNEALLMQIAEELTNEKSAKKQSSS